MEAMDLADTGYDTEDIINILDYYPPSDELDDLFDDDDEQNKGDDDAVETRSDRENEDDASFALPRLSTTTSDITTPSSIEGYLASRISNPVVERKGFYNPGSEPLFSSSSSSSSPHSGIDENYAIESVTSSSSSDSRIAPLSGIVKIQSEIESLAPESDHHRDRRGVSPTRSRDKGRFRRRGRPADSSTHPWRDRSRSALPAKSDCTDEEFRRLTTHKRKYPIGAAPADGNRNHERFATRKGPKLRRGNGRRNVPHLRLTSRPFGLPAVDRTATQRSYAKIIADAMRDGRKFLARLHKDLKSGFPRAELWLPSTHEARGSDNSSSHYISKPSWEEIMTGGPNLKRLFETQRWRVLAVSSGLREASLRNETLLESLGSADETLSWLKVHKRVGMSPLPTDPIFCTSRAILDNIKSKVTPVITCRQLRGSSRSIDCMLRRASPYDMTDPISFLFIMLARLSGAFGDRRNCKQACDVIGEVDPLGALNEYNPGDCSVGVVKYLTDHAKMCGDPACTSYIAGIIVHPDEFRGKYFTCI